MSLVNSNNLSEALNNPDDQMSQDTTLEFKTLSIVSFFAGQLFYFDFALSL